MTFLSGAGLAASVALLFFIAGYLLRERREHGATQGAAQAAAAAKDGRIVPEPPPPPSDSEAESPDVWGFRDTRFLLNQRGHVEVVGNRYELSGHELPAFVPWAREVLGIELTLEDTHPSRYPTAIPAPRLHRPFLDELRRVLDPSGISDDPLVRLRHGHGHTQEEMYAIKYDGLERVPDLVVFPTQEPQVSAIVEAASRHDVCLIPYGGGTNVTHALRCPTDERRMIVSVDMRRMNRVLWIDPVNRMARIEAGAVGREIAATLERHGFTMGHEPDSVEFSTLGGWIATHASGMKKNRYGNIEDLVLDVNVVTAAGKLERSAVAPRESVGVDPRRWVLGSEGNLGIITSAVVKLFDLPEVQRYGSILFPCYEDGVAFLYDLAQKGAVPASVRLVDNLQFQFSMALKPRVDGLRRYKSAFEKWFVTRVRGYDPQRMVACTLVFEGRRDEVGRQESAVYRIAGRHGGMKAGSENGRRGYQLTFSIAYIRDFIMNHYILGESFETSVPWSRVVELCDNVKRCIHEEHERRELPGKPFISCRVTQIYGSGVCVYFYFGFYYKGVAHPTEVYGEMEAAARREILRCGGSLSHHHGIGKLRERFLPEIMSPGVLEWNRRTKRALDPRNVFGGRNQGLVD